MSTGTGLNVSKAVTYVVLEKPLALNVSKAVTYVVLEKPLALNVSKAIAYTVLVPINSNPPVWPSFSFSNGVIKQLYMQAFDLAPAAVPTTISLYSGALPPGLSLESLGGDIAALTGTPSQLGTFTFQLLATNTYGSKVSQEFSITISLPTLGTQVAFAY